MEITWYGGTCVRLRGREGTVAADPYRAVVGPTGRGLTADVVTFSHRDGGPEPARGRRSATATEAGILLPTSLEGAFILERPGEFEVHDVLINGVRTFRDDARGAERGLNVAFIYELDGLRVIHLGDLGHTLSEARLGEVEGVQVVCVPVGSNLGPARAAEVVAQLDANLVVPLPTAENEADGQAAIARFVHEMGVTERPVAQARLAVSVSSVPAELTLVLLEARGRS
jgi:L-ascorbate metabolism protein UlaG (beta-lactamase superfamily)